MSANFEAPGLACAFSAQPPKTHLVPKMATKLEVLASWGRALNFKGGMGMSES